MRIFINTLNHAVDSIRRAGLEADTAKSETDEYFEYVIGQYSQDANSKIDNALLLEVYNDNIGILLTDDGAILKKHILKTLSTKCLLSS